MTDIQINLLEEARKAAELSYSPYSNFRVGAAVCADGMVFHGTNIENASSNLGICAERVAIANAVIHGASPIEGIAVFCVDAHKDSRGKVKEAQTFPCGACLQWISELAPNAWIVTNGGKKIYQITDLLPKPFGLK
jgi:cytidine deaminase